MRLWELLSNLGEKSLGAIEKELDSKDYQPLDKVLADKPVVDLDLSSPHFHQRVQQRGKTAGITPDEIEDLLHRGREKYKIEIGAASRQDDFGGQINFFDPETKLLIPTIIKPNPKCKPNSRGKITCKTVDGPAPKNALVAKTAIRKGVPD
jgi:hypothetical protein